MSSGFVAVETLFLAIQERESHSKSDEGNPIFPLIQGILTFDTPLNGLARSMFVYGAFSNYQKVSSVFNAMTALSAAAPVALGRLGARRTAASAARSSTPASKTWQMVAVKTGTVGAIAAGGVAAYTHRAAIMRGVKSMGNLNKDSVVAGYKRGVDSIGQGLAYINRGNVGKSFAWLSAHFTFVGSLLKPNELARRLERAAALKGVGFKDFYASLGENGYWSGGYFVPERTFCAIPADEKESKLFERVVMVEAEDEVIAHMSMFMPEKNPTYAEMKGKAADLVENWFLDESDVFDEPKLREAPRTKEEVEEDKEVEDALSGGSNEDVSHDAKPANEKDDDFGAESPIDIVAAASLVPLPDDGPNDKEPAEEAATESAGTKVNGDDKKQYLQYLFGVAQQTGTGLREWIPTKVPNVQVPNMPSMSSIKNVNLSNMPNMPNMPTFFSKRTNQSGGDMSAEDKDEKNEASVRVST